MTFEETLTAWMPTQRWFAGKGARILDLAIVADTELAGGDPGLRHLIIDVSQGSSVDSYQVFVGLRKRIPERLEHPVIGSAASDMGAGRLTAHHALHDPQLTTIPPAAIAPRDPAAPTPLAPAPAPPLHTH